MSPLVQDEKNGENFYLYKNRDVWYAGIAGLYSGQMFSGQIFSQKDKCALLGFRP